MSTKIFAADYLAKIYQRVNLEEGETVIEKLLVEIYFQAGISTKELARKVLLPVPIVAAVKGELIKEGLVVQDRGIRLSANGNDLVGNELGFNGFDYNFFQGILPQQPSPGLEPECLKLEEIFRNRPQVDVTIDQSKAVPLTSLKRALLCLQNHSLIGKQILCIGDDDLVSVALGFLLKRLLPRVADSKTRISVVDIDQRFLDYIQEITRAYSLPIDCRRCDLRNSLPPDLEDQFDSFLTDPPYTLPGMNLFLSRGITALKKRIGLPIFLSFAHKSPGFSLEMQQELLRMGLVIAEIIPRFNQYEGAEIIGNTGQMIILRTSRQTRPIVDAVDFAEPIYTGELKRTWRIYKCKECTKVVKIGFGGDFQTIEAVKKEGCPNCKNTSFDLVERTVIANTTIKNG